MENKYALITGASAGLGVEFARQIAQKGYNLIITARRDDRLKKLKGEIQKSLSDTSAIKIEIIKADLSKDADVKKIIKQIKKKKFEIEFLVNNAGYGYYGNFSDKDYAFWESMVNVNLNALVQLTSEFLPQMKTRKSGKILFVSSVGGFMAVPFFTVYASIKAFVLHFGEALAEEMNGSKIQIGVLCPGSTATEFFDVASGSGVKPTTGFASPADVVRAGLEGLESGKHIIVPGLLNKLQVFIIRFGNRRLVTRMAGQVMKKMH